MQKVNKNKPIYLGKVGKRRNIYIRLLLILLIFVVLFFSSNYVIRYLGSFVFKIKDVQLVGRNEADKNDILQALDLYYGMPLLSLDIDESASKLKKDVFWIKEARIIRIYPSIIRVMIKEYVPYFLLQEKNNFHLVSKTGDIILDDVEQEKYKNLPLITASDSNSRTIGMIMTLLDALKQQQQLFNKIKFFTLIRGRRWDLLTKNDVLVKMPENNLAYSLRLLNYYQNHYGILSKRIATLDLRFKGRILLTPRTE